MRYRRTYVLLIKVIYNLFYPYFSINNNNNKNNLITVKFIRLFSLLPDKDTGSMFIYQVFYNCFSGQNLYINMKSIIQKNTTLNLLSNI